MTKETIESLTIGIKKYVKTISEIHREAAVEAKKLMKNHQVSKFINKANGEIEYIDSSWDMSSESGKYALKEDLIGDDDLEQGVAPKRFDMIDQDSYQVYEDGIKVIYVRAN